MERLPRARHCVISAACSGLLVPPTKPASHLLLSSLFSRLRNSVTQLVGSLAQGYTASKEWRQGERKTWSWRPEPLGPSSAAVSSFL